MNNRGKLDLSAIQAAAQAPESAKKAPVRAANFTFAYMAEKNLRKRAKTCALANDVTLSAFMEEAVEVALGKYEA